MKKLLLSVLLSLLALPAAAQRFGNYGDPIGEVIASAPTAGTAAWTSATAVDTTLAATVTGYGCVLFDVRVVPTISTGAIIFEATRDGSNWSPLQVFINAVVTPGEQLTGMNYGLNVGSAYFERGLMGFTKVRLRLNPVITGAGTANVAILPMAGSCATPLTIDNNGKTKIAIYNINQTPVVSASAGVMKVGVSGATGATMDAAGQNASSPANELLVAGQFNTTPSTITSGNVSPIQLNSKGQALAQLSDGTTNVGVISGTTALKTDMSSVAGTATSTAAAGIQKVGVVGNAGGAFDAAAAAAPPANRVAVGGLTSGATGGLMSSLTVCDSVALVNIVTATTTSIITGVSGRLVHICAIALFTAGANNVAIIEGSTSSCTTPVGMWGGTTAATGLLWAAGGGMAYGSGTGDINRSTVTGNNVCIITSAAVQLSGRVSYAIY